MNEPSENLPAAPEKQEKRRRLRHEWREASNPLDQLVGVAGWLFLAAMVLTVGFFLWRKITGGAE